MGDSEDSKRQDSDLSSGEGDLKQLPANWLTYIKDPVLYVILGAYSLTVYKAQPLREEHLTGFITIIVILSVTLLIGIFVRYIFLERSEKRKRTLQRLTTKLEQQTEINHKLKIQLESPPISVITKQDYGALIKKWNNCGPGHLLLFNIELQSFQTDDDIKRTWGNVSELKNIKSVVLLLPDHKVRRWESVVKNQADKFFKIAANHKFEVCRYSTSELRLGVAAAPSIGFALYRLGNDPGSGKLHSSAIVFIMSGPFSYLRQPQISGDDPWWDYHHIIHFNDDNQVTGNLDQIWTQYFSGAGSRNIKRVLEDVKELEPMEPEVLFERLGVSETRSKELLDHLSDRPFLKASPVQINFDSSENRKEFFLNYKNGQRVKGHCTGGGNPNPRLPLIWVGGFTERQDSRLPKLFERALNLETVRQFQYEVSPETGYVTLTRYRQDMQEVLRYVRQQRSVLQDRTILVARSINAMLAAMVAAEDEFLEMLSGVVLIAPIFDLESMINNYRFHRNSSLSHVTLEKCWRHAPGYTADKWEDPKQGWMEFFGHHVSLTLFADIIRNDRATFSLDMFKEHVGTISQRCPVYILSNPDDPVTGSQDAIKALKNAASGTGSIRLENYQHVSIKSSHLLKIERGQYPFAMREELEKTQTVVRDLVKRLGIANGNEEIERD